MLDFRVTTFLTLCEQKSYTKTAELLHITQPAVTQHIRFLEDHYGCRLFSYRSRTLSLTPKGEQLRDLLLSLQSDSARILDRITKDCFTEPPLRCGATLTIGEFIMPPIIKKMLEQNENLHVITEVSNTRDLLQKLRQGSLDFVLLEGFFDSSKYESFSFSSEEYIAVTAPTSPLPDYFSSISQLFDQRLIIREEGSGTREIIEQLLYEHNASLQDFQQRLEIGSLGAIKELVKQQCGISFLYRTAVEQELARKELRQIHIQGTHVIREFHFVFLKDSIIRQENIDMFQTMKTIWDTIKKETASL